MSYTIRNIKEIEDSAPKFGFAPDLEARFARKPLGMQKSGLGYERLAPNKRGPFGHTHEQQEETYVVVGGSGRVKIGDEILGVRQWDAVRVDPETMRCFEAGPDGLEVIVFGAPASPETGPEEANFDPEFWKD